MSQLWLKRVWLWPDQPDQFQHLCVTMFLLTRRYSQKVNGKRSSRKPTSLENLFRTRPAVETIKKMDRWRDRQVTERNTDRQWTTHLLDWCQRTTQELGGQQQTFCCVVLWRHSHRQSRRQWCVQNWWGWLRQWCQRRCQSSDWWWDSRRSAMSHSQDERH